MKVILEPGLYGTGPRPIHLHRGHPTPWSEEYIYRIVPNSSPAWIANAQPGSRDGYEKDYVIWEEANVVVLIANRAIYFVNPDSPNEWKYIPKEGIKVSISPERDCAIIHNDFDVFALDSKGQEIWWQGVGFDGVEIHNIENGLIQGRAGYDLPGGWRPFKIRIKDGKEVE